MIAIAKNLRQLSDLSTRNSLANLENNSLTNHSAVAIVDNLYNLRRLYICRLVVT